MLLKRKRCALKFARVRTARPTPGAAALSAGRGEQPAERRARLAGLRHAVVPTTEAPFTDPDGARARAFFELVRTEDVLRSSRASRTPRS